MASHHIGGREDEVEADVLMSKTKVIRHVSFVFHLSAVTSSFPSSERESVCMCERERERVCVCEKERECVCVSVREIILHT